MMPAVSRAARGACLAALLLPVASALQAQEWNAPAVRALVERAIQRREVERADSGLRDFQARAHGFVFFLGQLGEQLSEPPRLIKADQLELEVYWKAPGASKQRIMGWRDRVDLPTEIQYHRDHLGIVQNGFGDRIRLGQGDEVRDVPHPLSPAGDSLYDFALADSLDVELPQRSVRVYAVRVRPRHFERPGVIGVVYLDVQTAELVRFHFSFTRAAYLDPSLEDITVALDNGLWEARYWLPRRQEIEIRRRTEWLDLPARGIIRGVWNVDSYAFNVGLPDSLFRGPEIAAAPPAVRDTFPWSQPLAAAIRAVDGPRLTVDPESVRAQVARLAGAHMTSGLARAMPAVSSISDLAHVNRVEGLALGAGYRVRPGARVDVLIKGSFGLADHRPKGLLQASLGGPEDLRLSIERELHDVGDEPVISPLVNSLSAQEGGADFGDYTLLNRARLSARRRVLGLDVGIAVGVEQAESVAVAATPARGTYRSNPALWGPRLFVLLGSFEWRGGGEVAGRRSWRVSLESEQGSGSGVTYSRERIAAQVLAPIGPGAVLLHGWAGSGTGELPAYRAFVLGGRGTLLGEPFRAYGGRRAALAGLELRWPVPFPAVPLGPLVSTGDEATVAPFVAVGWADQPLAGTPWAATGGGRAVAGGALELFHGLLRAEVGVGLRDGKTGFSVDVRRDLWPIL